MKSTLLRFLRWMTAIVALVAFQSALHPAQARGIPQACNAMADAQDALLTWTTTAENLADYYVIERSADALVWTEVGMVPASTGTLYTYRNQAAGHQGLVWYHRIRMERSNGQKLLSPVARVQFNLNQDQVTHLKMYPTLVQENLTIEWANTPLGSENRLSVMDASGHERYSVMLTPSEGTSSQSVSFAGLPSGMYFVRYGEQVRRVFKQ